ncbi:ribosomal protein L31 [Oscillochloris trichoides DG-6]|uniref:Large ribosomal subunit protein bL31 n=1 Tax=Oscillochloris trichoides DG-6 TaxID=765420 RepID=E1IFP1_9CHLR|nr:50S ribosomal protein L31 [Oscillochloris trichoides]EFO79987.1 ribosomal protein L31 [Oscillochloris trichoides DG-6]
MKNGIHPKYHTEGIVCTTCGTHWKIGSTRPNMRVEICSNCHPFYTGEQRIVDTAGQVDRFMRRLSAAQDRQATIEKQRNARNEPAPKKSLLKEIYGDEA